MSGRKSRPEFDTERPDMGRMLPSLVQRTPADDRGRRGIRSDFSTPTVLLAKETGCAAKIRVEREAAVAGDRSARLELTAE